MTKPTGSTEPGYVRIAAPDVTLEANLTVPDHARTLVIFAHGSGSGRQSPRNRYVAEVLQRAGLATLLADLLTRDEEVLDQQTMHLRFDIPLLAERLLAIAQWASQQPATKRLKIGYFGASTGAAAALVAAAGQPASAVGAIVSRGGRPDLAGALLGQVHAPTLLIVGENDPQVHFLNRQAFEVLAAKEKELVVIPGATHLFEEPGALEEVARVAAQWFTRHH